MELRVKQLTIEFINKSSTSADPFSPRKSEVEFADKLGQLNMEWEILKARVSVLCQVKVPDARSICSTFEFPIRNNVNPFESPKLTHNETLFHSHPSHFNLLTIYLY